LRQYILSQVLFDPIGRRKKEKGKRKKEKGKRKKEKGKIEYLFFLVKQEISFSGQFLL
jgi:hypothetical protein